MSLAEHATRAQAWRALASTMSNLGYLSLLQGDAVRGIEQCREAARRFEELGIRDEQAGAAVNVAIGLAETRRRRGGARGRLRQPGDVR